MTENIQPFTKEYLIDHLKHMRDDWSDEIPTEILHSDAPNKMFKVRTNWFVGLSADLSNALDEGLIKDKSLRRKINEFLDWYGNDFGRQPSETRTKKSDIYKANKIINEVLEKI